ncbi:hypothetical protein [Algoriphagus sp.]|uniref:hypothetical protein n=1 Tax=Algoriphagus sp. TaxID=1872435 RepID=UPI00391CFF23
MISFLMISFGMIPMAYAQGPVCEGAIAYLDPSCQLLAGPEGGADVYACEGEDGTIFAVCSSPTTMGGCAGPATNCAGGY